MDCDEQVVTPFPDQHYRDFLVYRQFLPHVLTTFPDKNANVVNALLSYTKVPVADEASGLFSDPIRIVNLFQALESANKLDDGDYVELGTHRGYFLRAVHKLMDPSRTLYSLDTFDGFDSRDISVEKTIYDNDWVEGNFKPTSIKGVANYVGDGHAPDNLILIKGWFPDTFEQIRDVRWRFVHIDFDLYQPIKCALEAIWEPLLPGGIVMIHDYGCYGFPGARQAVDEFCADKGVWPVELCDRWSTAILRKPGSEKRPIKIRQAEKPAP